VSHLTAGELLRILEISPSELRMHTASQQQ
jgi:hypothetical protein